MFYTLLASLRLLVGNLFVYNSLGSLCLFLLSGSNSLVGGLFCVCMVFALEGEIICMFVFVCNFVSVLVFCVSE